MNSVMLMAEVELLPTRRWQTLMTDGRDPLFPAARSSFPFSVVSGNPAPCPARHHM